MPDFSESLTIRILADSSQLHRELDNVTIRISELQARLAQAVNPADQLGQAAGNVTGMLRPLEQVSRLLGRITEQARALGRVPISLNVAPALTSLQMLSAAIDAIAAKLRALAAMPVGIGAPLPFPVPGPIRRFATGGLVTGPAGTDRVPALLTSGEFVLRPAAVQQLGLAFLNAVNQPRPPAAAVSPTASSAPAQVNNIGGIAVHVTQPVNLQHLLRDLRFQAHHLRTRRG
jgi:hypothetical protein